MDIFTIDRVGGQGDESQCSDRNDPSEMIERAQAFTAVDETTRSRSIPLPAVQFLRRIFGHWNKLIWQN